MPQAVVVAVASAAASYASGATFAAVAMAFAKSLALGLISRALAPKPPRGGAASGVAENTIAVRQTDASHKYIYGQTRISDVYAEITTSGNDNKFIYMAVILCAHEIDEIGEIWADDYCIPSDWLDTDGKVIRGRYKDKVWINKHLGSPNQTVDTMFLAEVSGWTTDHRLRGIAYLAIKMEYDRDKFPSGEPNFSAIIKGKKLYDPRTNATGFSSNMVLACNDYMQGEYGVAVNAENMDDTNTAVEASIADEIVDTADKDMTVGFNADTELDDGVSPAPSSVDTTTGIIALQGDRLLFEIGDRVRLFSSNSPATLPTGFSTGTDYYVIPYQFKKDPRIKLAASLSDAMAGVHITPTTTGSGTITVRKTGEPRYHGAGIIDTAETLEENLDKFRLSFAGRIIYIGGLWKIVTAAWRAPAVSFDKDDMANALSVRTDITSAETFNIIRGLYVSSINDYSSTDYPEVKNATFITEDNEREMPTTIHRPMTNRSDTAQRLGAIDLKRERQKHTASITTTFKALQVQPGDVVTLDFSHFGYSAKEFEIVSQTFQIEGGLASIKLDMRETAEGVYTWSLTDAAAVDPAPNSTLPNPYSVTGVTGIAYNSVQVDTRDGDVLYQLVASWNPHADQFVLERGMYEIQYKLSADADYLPSFFVDGSQTSAVIVQGSSVNVAYDFRIRAVNNLGVRGAFSTLTNAVVGSSGGVGSTENWQTFSDTVSSSQNWQTFSDTVSSSEDWSYYT